MQSPLLPVFVLILEQGEWPAPEKPKPEGISALLNLELKFLKFWANLKNNLEETYKSSFPPIIKYFNHYLLCWANLPHFPLYLLFLTLQETTWEVTQALPVLDQVMGSGNHFSLSEHGLYACMMHSIPCMSKITVWNQALNDIQHWFKASLHFMPWYYTAKQAFKPAPKYWEKNGFSDRRRTEIDRKR